MLDPKAVGKGQEQHEQFETGSRFRPMVRVQYDYRDADGELFSTVKRTLEDCRAARDEWAAKRALAVKHGA
jgi:hypothetical protein